MDFRDRHYLMIEFGFRPCSIQRLPPAGFAEIVEHNRAFYRRALIERDDLNTIATFENIENLRRTHGRPSKYFRQRRCWNKCSLALLVKTFQKMPNTLRRLDGMSGTRRMVRGLRVRVDGEQ